MSHIGGEALDGGDAVVKRFGHVLQGGRQIADFVLAGGEIGNAAPRLAADAVRRAHVAEALSFRINAKAAA